jgi:hypothetical protein
MIYNFNLIYRRSRDGNNMIRNKCIGQGAILILIKCSEKIFGGYNPIGWNILNDNYNLSGKVGRKKSYNQYLSTTESFIFSFENNEDIKNMKISRVVDSSHAIYNYRGNGINFGGGDLALENDCLSLSYTGYYENLEGNNYDNRYQYEEDNYYNVHYKVEEIEAFSVKKIK